VFLTLPEYAEKVPATLGKFNSVRDLRLTEFQIIGAKTPADHFIQNNKSLFPLTDRTIPNFVLTLGEDWDSFKSDWATLKNPCVVVTTRPNEYLGST
jgi:hypothetical protein